MIGGGIRAVAAANDRRAERRLEKYRIKQQTKIAVAEASGRAKVDEVTSRRELTKLLGHHDRIDARWLDYEMDVAKLLDFPMMTDMRQPLTVAFHKSRSPGDRRRRHRRPRDPTRLPRRGARVRLGVRRGRGGGHPQTTQ
jgi:hypothetical protein